MGADNFIPTVIDRFNNGHFDQLEVMRAYKLYRLDDSDDDVLESEGVQDNVVTFWSKLEKMEFQPFAGQCI